MGEWILIITLGTCSGILLSKIALELYSAVRKTQLNELVKKLKPKKQADDTEAIRIATKKLIQTKPGKVKNYNEGDKRVVDYFESKIRATIETKNPNMRSIITHELSKAKK